MAGFAQGKSRNQLPTISAELPGFAPINDLTLQTRPKAQPAVKGLFASLANIELSNSCAALGVTARSSSPVLALCRKLIDAGHDPATPMDVYRGDTLALRVRSIGEAARLQVNARGTGFVALKAVRTASLMRQNLEAAEESAKGIIVGDLGPAWPSQTSLCQTSRSSSAATLMQCSH